MPAQPSHPSVGRRNEYQRGLAVHVFCCLA